MARRGQGGLPAVTGSSSCWPQARLIGSTPATMKVLINLQFCNLEFDLILGFDLKQLGVPVFPTGPEEVKVYLLDLCGG